MSAYYATGPPVAKKVGEFVCLSFLIASLCTGSQAIPLLVANDSPNLSPPNGVSSIVLATKENDYG